MATIEVRTGKNNELVFKSLLTIDVRATRAVRRGFFNWGKQLKDTANKNILDKATKTGRIYIRVIKGGARRRHQSSAPGETHANFSGTLRKSLSFKVPASSDTLKFGYGLATVIAPEYAEWVEFGTTRMEARPSLQNAIKETAGNAERFFNTQLRKEL